MSADFASLVIGFPGEIARRTAARLASRGLPVRLLASPSLEAEASAFARELPGAALVVPGDLDHIDLGLPGAEYLSLAAGLENILLAAQPAPPCSEESNAAAGDAVREVLELALAAPGPAHVLILSHVDVAGDFNGRFAERDLDLGQRFGDPSGGGRFVAERICRRFSGRIPLTVVRGGWPVGPDPGLAPVIAMMLGVGEEIDRWAERRLCLADADGLARLMGDLVEHPPESGGRTLHAVEPSFPTVADLARRVALEARELAPGSFDLAAGARRSLQRARGGARWQPREFFEQQPRARIETAWSKTFIADRELPRVEVGEDETSRLIEHAIEEIVGLR